MIEVRADHAGMRKVQQTFSRLATPFRLLTSEWQAYHWDMKDTAGFHWRPAVLLASGLLGFAASTITTFAAAPGSWRRPFGKMAAFDRYMKTMTLVLLLAIAFPATSRAQEARFFRVVGPVATTITAFSADGYMTWTNEPTNATFTVQMATSLGGVSNWADYVRIPVINGVNTNRITDPNPPAGLAWIPAGSFTMGSPTTEAQRDSDEMQHMVS